MRRWIIGAFFAGLALAGGYAAAQIVPALPFQLQNNTVADATQVMANFNQILNNVNSNAARNGANSDITSLLGLTTPLAPSVGGTTVYTGGTASGTANALVVTPIVPATFSLAVGSRIVFVAAFTNTAAATINVAGTGAKNIYRRGIDTGVGGVGPLVGGEIVVGGITELAYDGTQFQVIGGPPVLVGQIADFPGATPPAGWVFADGSCLSQTTYAALAFVVGSSWGTCPAGQFAVPDYRGRYGVGKDGGAARITTVCAAGNTLATGCGAQNTSVTVAQANLPSVTWPKTLAVSNGTLATGSTLAVNNGTLAASNNTLAISNTMGVSDTRTWATSNSLYPTGGAQGFAAGATVAAAAAAQSVGVTGGAISLTGGTSLTGSVSLTGTIALTGGVSLTGSVSLSGDTTSGGSGTAITVPTLSPSIVVNKIIKL